MSIEYSFLLIITRIPKRMITEPDFDQVDPELNLPSSHLYLREFGGESLVLAKQHLKAGTVLGTYKGCVQDPDTEDSNSLLKVNRSDGGSPVHVMLEDEGHWLKLMRTTLLPTEANICLRISGADILCTVTKDVNKEVELKVTCRIVDKEEAQQFNKIELRPKDSLKEICESDWTKNETNESDIEQQDCMKSEKMLDFVPEAIVNSREEMSSKHSLRDNEREQDVKKLRIENHEESDNDMKDKNDEVSSSTVHRPPSSGENIDIHRMHSPGETLLRDRTKSLDTETIQKPRQHGEAERIYRCPYCTFMSDEQSVLDKHILSHRHPTTKKASSKMTNSKSYCEACKIQFMSIDTYRVHKQMYCKSRNEKGTTSPSPLPESALGPTFKPGPEAVIIRGGVNGGVASSIIQPQAIYAAISTNPLILLPCSLVNGQGLVSQKAVIPTGAPGIVLQTGITCPTIVEKPPVAKIKEENPPSRKTSHPIMNFSADSSDRTLSAPCSLRKRKTSEGDVLNLKKTCATEPLPLTNSDTEKKETEPLPVDQDIPLDLSLKNKLINLSSKSPTKRKNSVASAGSPSPSFPNTSDSISPPRSSLLHSRISVSPSSPYSGDMYHYYPSSGILPRIPHVSDRMSPLPPILQPDAPVDKVIPPAGMPPPKLLKQGDNVCEECHIVFYKYDNYLAHKKHYCAFRRQQLSAIAAAAASSQEQLSDDNNSNHSGHNDSSTSYQSDDASKTVMRRAEHPVEPFRSVITKSTHSVYCCDACGVKFSTSDNLFAHQTYYCIKKADSAMSKAAALRGDNADSPKGLESPFSGPEEWKCNYCDATCASYDTIRRHLLTHSELRGFRCIVCGYKGNTLRGMRTHACEHLSEGTTSIEEFVSNNVIAENGVVPILPQSLDHSDDDSDHSKENKTISRREMAYLERMRERSSSSKRETPSTDHSESNELSSSPKMTENSTKEHVPNRISPIKMESNDSSHDASGSSHQEAVNPLAFCDVVIKAENDHSSGEEDSLKEEPSTFIKYEPEPEYDSDDKPRESSNLHPGQSTSVIRRAADLEKPEGRLSPFAPSKRKSRTQGKQNSDLKYCKSCDISFYHLSNFLAHKKYYCVSRVMQNCIQEAATVQ
ncbi:uncharacterized protein NPIL_594941 [Nephila pilipes]|uniref:Zinc finger protein ush n=1 Tax=Nephila pilipes TaxID=299642 RepID=A0A8X6QT68_NEPPI|nr:uncharacterized protein NPIL_594941 [Nephila pilipes]